MTLRIACLFLLVVSPLAAEKNKADPKADQAALKGKWEVVSAKFDGQDAASVKGKIIVFGDGEFATYDDDKKGRTLTFTLDPTTDPKGIDIDRGSDAVKAVGIYAIAKDELKICYAEPGASRPKAFTSAVGEKRYLLALKRLKE